MVNGLKLIVMLGSEFGLTSFNDASEDAKDVVEESFVKTIRRPPSVMPSYSSASFPSAKI